MNRLILEKDQHIRTATIRVKNLEDKQRIQQKLFKYRHVENMLLILLEQNYNLFKEGKDSNDFLYISNYQIMRAVISGTKGGKVKEQVKYIKNKYKDNKIMQQIIQQGKKLKIHNLAMMINKVKSDFQSFFSKIATGDKKARPPSPKKLSNIN